LKKTGADPNEAFFRLFPKVMNILLKTDEFTIIIEKNVKDILKI